MRLAHLYALLDRSDEIKLPHLQAALALWDYSLRSVQHVFGASLGDPTADTILDGLRRAQPQGVSRTEIRSYVGGRVQASQIEKLSPFSNGTVSPTCGRRTQVDALRKCGSTGGR
jgi:hypothetical protein